MEENKNINPELEEVAEQAEAQEAQTDAITEPVADNADNVEDKKAKKEKSPKAKKPKKAKLLKNQALFKRGSYSVAITAALIAGVIIFNILVGALSDRFVLEFDMSTEKTNSISEENIEYIKAVKDKVDIIFCADAESYVGGYMSYYAQQYNVNQDAADYYNQTINLVDRYADYNKNITVTYMDTQSAEFAKIAQKYSGTTIGYGDIIVSTEKNGVERHKIIGFKDIYYLQEDNSYASYGITTATVAGNNIETALTSAIAYVTSADTKKVAILTGHSAQDYTAEYQTLLKNNNYDVEIIADTMITSISDEFDAIVIAAPTTDFIGTELDAISKFLDNGGKLDKGLIFFANNKAPYLPNFYDLLAQWGINVDEGVLFETNESNHVADDPLTLGTYPTAADDVTDGASICITGGNLPITAGFETQGSMKVTTLVATPESTVAAPVGTAAGWTGAGNYEKQSYAGVIQSVKEDYDDDNNQILSYVMAFSSTDFIYSEYAEYASVGNKNVALGATERAAGAEDAGISFVSKTITTESFADKVTATSTNVIRIIFMVLLPLTCIVLGIVIFIRRRNA